MTTPTIEVESIDKSIHQCIQKMHGVLRETHTGIALAANQVSESYRIFVYIHNNLIKTVINPKIIFGEIPIVNIEGCLSFPNRWIPIARDKRINVKYVDFPSMEERDEDISFLTARIFQHECEHLCGHLFIDNLSEDEKNEFLSRTT